MCSFEHEVGYCASRLMCAGNSLTLVGVSFQCVLFLHIRLLSGFSAPLTYPCMVLCAALSYTYPPHTSVSAASRLRT